MGIGQTVWQIVTKSWIEPPKFGMGWAAQTGKLQRPVTPTAPMIVSAKPMSDPTVDGWYGRAVPKTNPIFERATLDRLQHTADDRHGPDRREEQLTPLVSAMACFVYPARSFTPIIPGALSRGEPLASKSLPGSSNIPATI